MMADIADYGKINDIYGSCELIKVFSLNRITFSKLI